MKRTCALLAVLTVMVFWSSDTRAAQPGWMDRQTGKLVEEARKSTKQVTVTELKQALDQDQELIMLDVRTPREYEAAHIPNAISAPRGLLEFSIWSLVPDQDQQIWVYCRSGARAALATKLLNDFGYKNAVSVKTGMMDWAKSGYPVQTSITNEQLIIKSAE